MMNEYSEQKFEQLLSSLNKKEYPLNKWMEEDESEAFDRIVGKRKREKTIRRWIAVAACLVFIVGIAGIAKLTQSNERQNQLPQPVVAKVEPIPKQELTIQEHSREEIKEKESSQTVRKHRKLRNSAKKPSKPKKQLTETEPTTEPTEENDICQTVTNFPQKEDPFVSVAHQMGEIRQRGVQLSKAIAMFINDK